MINPRKTVFLWTLGLIVLGFIGLHLYVYNLQRSIQLPDYVEVDELYFPDQNWTSDEQQWFYHETQGGAFELIVEYDWLMALEQPRLPFFLLTEVPRLVDPEYISRFGFLPNPVTSFDSSNVRKVDWAVLPSHEQTEINLVNNPDALPVGFAPNFNYEWPIPSASRKRVIGFTCAACHVGQLNYTDSTGIVHGIRINGGPAMTNLTKFELAVGISVGLTMLPFRFQRFADRVLGEGHSDEQKRELKSKLQSFLDLGKIVKAESDSVYTTMDGFARIDALGRIGNFIFAEEVSRSNWSLSNAPVNYPPLWDTPWFDWVQYNGSIKLPMIRNAGEAMGVFSRVNFDSLGTDYLFRSTIRLDNLYELESLVRGDAPFEGLRSPKWPEHILGPIDATLASRGADLYKVHCQGCHHAAPVDGSPFFDTSDTTIWTPRDTLTGLSYLDLKMVNLYEIGTDPLTAENFARRIVNMGALGEIYRDSLGVDGGGKVMFSTALAFTVRQAIRKGYNDLGVPDSLRPIWNGLRKDETRAPLAYKARPLDGVWATAPYLHNGSVPTLMQMLGPYSNRARSFYLGTKEFNPDSVGFVTDRIPGGFRLDTSLPGNSNYGHLFQGDFDPTDPSWGEMDWNTLPSGIIGPSIPHEDRLAIVEFLKSL